MLSPAALLPLLGSLAAALPVANPAPVPVMGEGIAARAATTVTRVVTLEPVTIRPGKPNQVARQATVSTIVNLPTVTVTAERGIAARQFYDQNPTVTDIVNLPTVTVTAKRPGIAGRQFYDQNPTVTDIVNLPTVTVTAKRPGIAARHLASPGGSFTTSTRRSRTS
ncbi:hypothetical protein VTJ49DRAFT_3129 [Mycothermus thermophilus]|uniref:Uncharacterized protein n=1 Tax=Humicola insolens TaxID=85995 RepID=A0ABR3V8B1_HUMIN